MIKLEKIRQYLKLNLTNARFSHCEGVEKASEQLARRFNVSLEKCRLAGLSHDICREMPEYELLEYTGLQHKNPLFLHGIAGEKKLREFFNIHDESVLKAVKYHISGTSGMDEIGKIVFAADFLEEGRHYLKASERERLFLLDLDDMVLDIAVQIRTYLSRRNAAIDSDLYRLIGELQKEKTEES